MKLFEYRPKDTGLTVVQAPVDAAQPIIVALPGIIPTREIFNSFEEIEKSAPEFYHVMDSARKKCQAHGSDSWSIGIFAQGLHDIIVHGFFNLTRAIGGDDLLKPTGGSKPARLLTLSTDSVEQNIANMRALIDNPETYVSTDMDRLGELLFRQNVFDESGAPRAAKDIAARLGHITLFAVSMGNTQSVELETKLYTLLKEAGHEAQADRLAANVKMVGIGCCFTCLNGKAFDKDGKGVLTRPGFTRALYESTQDVYTDIFAQKRNCADIAKEGPVITDIGNRSVHILFHSPSARRYRSPNDGAETDITDYTFHRPESVALEDIRHTKGSDDDTAWNTVPRMISRHLRAAVQTKGPVDMTAIAQGAGMELQ